MTRRPTIQPATDPAALLARLAAFGGWVEVASLGGVPAGLIDGLVADRAVEVMDGGRYVRVVAVPTGGAA